MAPKDDFDSCVKTTCAGLTGDALTHCIDGCAKVVVGNIIEESSKAVLAQITKVLQTTDKATKASVASVLNAALQGMRKVSG